MLFDSFALGNTKLANRTVMAPMTRSRALNNLPSELIAQYYAQRSVAAATVQARRVRADEGQQRAPFPHGVDPRVGHLGGLEPLSVPQ